MSDEDKGFTTNQDGSIDFMLGGKAVRYAKESDLLAVKSAAEKQEKVWDNEKTQFNTQLAEANRLRDETHQQLLQAQAASEQLAEQFKDYDTHKARVGELETELGSHRERLSGYEKEVTERIRQSLLAAGVTEDNIKDKTLDQLKSLEDAAKVFVGLKAIPARYAGSKPVGGDGTSEAPLDRARRILEENAAKGHSIGSRVPAPRS